MVTRRLGESIEDFRKRCCESSKRYRDTHVLKDRSEYMKKYEQENKERIALRKKKYHQKNREHIAIQKKEYEEKNKERIREYHKQWYEENKERIKQIHDIHYAKNKQHYSDYHRVRNRKIVDDLIDLLGRKCFRENCSNTDLHIDHKYGGGRAERMFRFNGQRHEMYKWYLEHPDKAIEKLQSACSYHNREKQILNKENGKDYIDKWRKYYEDNPV